MAYIQFDHVVKEYKSGETSIRALNDANFLDERRELPVILGASGAANTNALNILGSWAAWTAPPPAG